MEMVDTLHQHELGFLLNLGLALLCGLIIGLEREHRNKPAGVSTQTLVIAGSMTFAFLSTALSSGDPSRIAAQIVSGIGFLGAGLIFKSESKNIITGVTTAASIWYAAAVGMAIGFELYFVAISAALFAPLVARLPHIQSFRRGNGKNDTRQKLIPEE